MNTNAADLPKATNEMERKRNIEAGSKQNSDLKNPCLKEQMLSYKCLDKTNYDQEACTVAFANYKACRQFWDQVMSDRRRAGIRPLLPPVDERPAIKAEYMKKLHGT